MIEIRAMVVAVAVLGTGLASACVGADEEDLALRSGIATDGGTDGTDGGGDSWTSGGGSTTWTGESSDGGADLGTGTYTKIPLYTWDFENANAGPGDVGWSAPGHPVVYPSVPGCIEVYQHSCEGFKKPPWPDSCQSSNVLRDFYADPQCTPFQAPKQVVVNCDEFCGDGGGSCDFQTIHCGVGQVKSAYCNCNAK